MGVLKFVKLAFDSEFLWTVCREPVRVKFGARKGLALTGKFGAHEEVWRSRRSLALTRKFGAHGEVWRSQGSLALTGKFGAHKEVWRSGGHL